MLYAGKIVAEVWLTREEENLDKLEQIHISPYILCGRRTKDNIKKSGLCRGSRSSKKVASG